MTLAPEISRQARCGTPENRDLVDAAFARTGGPAQRRLEKLCGTCPIWAECLKDGLDNHEHGPWGGTNERTRRARTGHWYTSCANLSNIADEDRHTHAPPGPDQPKRAHYALVTALGVSAREIKVWAVGSGLLDHVGRGTPGLAIVEAYAAAHHPTVA